MPKLSKKAAIQKLVRDRGWERIDKAHWDSLRESYSENAIRNALSEIEVAIDQPFAGVAIKTIAGLEDSLTAMAIVYASEPVLRQECRRQVITAKDRARFAARNAKVAAEKRLLKEEMVEWMLVWLGDPAMFATWATLRKRAAYCNSTEST